ncbi:MAG: hypothetical protein ACK5JU_10380 [Bacteroidales bacterium]
MSNVQTPLTRYLYKYHNQRKEIKKLKAHEKDFLFKCMYILRNEEGAKYFDLSEIDEASEYYFNKLILIYSENLNFDKPTKNSFGQEIDTQTMAKDKDFFDNYYSQWTNRIKTKEGKYLSIIHAELSKKQKDLRLIYNEGKIDEAAYNYQVKYLNTVAFWIYYKVKLFFDGLTYKFVSINKSRESIIVNIYSFVHILFRHYIPSMDIGSIDRSINDPITFLDIENLPSSIKNLLTAYFQFDTSPLTSSREYLLFSYNRDKYIIWLKYHKLEELNNRLGFEFRTLYKCIEKRDLDKFNGLSEHKVNVDLSFYF